VNVTCVEGGADATDGLQESLAQPALKIHSKILSH